MNNNNLFDEYTNIYKSYINTPIDSSYIIQWYKTTTEKNRTSQMFKVYLLNSDIYSLYISSKYEKIYYKLITTPIKDIYVKEFIATIKDTIVTDDKIYNFILKSTIYKEFYTNLIELFYKYLTNVAARPEIIDKYSDFFKEKANSYELIAQKICDDEKLTENKIIKLKEKHFKLKNYEIDLKTIIQILTTLKDDNAITNSLIINNNIFDNEKLYAFINAYTKTFKRDIHILEFIKNYPLVCLDVNNNYNCEDDNNIGLNDSIQSLYNTHTAKYMSIKNLYKKYLDNELTEKDYLVKYHKTSDFLNFETLVTDDLIEKDTYEKLMKEKISTFYKETYSKDISVFDLKYCFENFKKLKYTLVDNKVGESITKIVDITKKYSKELNIIYTNLLGREPDTIEYKKYVTIYRQNDNISGTNKSIENEILNSSFEYQMVLKDKIIKMYEEIFNTKILPSVIYLILKDVLSQNTECRNNDESLKKIISTYEQTDI